MPGKHKPARRCQNPYRYLFCSRIHKKRQYAGQQVDIVLDAVKAARLIPRARVASVMYSDHVLLHSPMKMNAIIIQERKTTHRYSRRSFILIIFRSLRSVYENVKSIAAQQVGVGLHLFR
jgi:hypothetical protein